ncbi:unnamed protein product [Trifolium pratense]|uniref:Uncharacterized protein n=1 Tax=Trifolium pratense TaxID=57577 RepID=A0ACB0LZL6_TRIPR|nr:unnamed protein product [Trifolium pratense]
MILVAIQPLLINEDYSVCVEARGIISTLSKVAGLPSMIAAMSAGIHDSDENVRKTTAKVFSCVAYALGVSELLPFLKTVCQCQESWQARHTGITIMYEFAIYFGSSVSHKDLRSLVEIIKHGLIDENDKVMIITALSITALAKATTAPSGIECFETVLKPLLTGITQHSGKVLAAFLKAIGRIIPLMGAFNANKYTNEVMSVLIREFKSTNEVMKKIVLKVVKQCVSTEGVEAAYIRDNVVPEFLDNFWDMGVTLDRRNYKLLVETTIDDIAKRIIENLTNNSESRRQLAMEAIEKVVSNFRVCDTDLVFLIEGILHAFNKQTVNSSDDVILNGFGTVVTSLGMRVKPHFHQIFDALNQGLQSQNNNKVRKQSADLISRIAAVMKQCEMDQVLCDLCILFFNNLEPEYPEVLDSFLEALNSIIDVIGVTNTTLPMNDLVASLSRLLDERSYKVQEVCINLLGRIAYDDNTCVSRKNWMKICFKILEKFLEPKKVIRSAAVKTFSMILKFTAVSSVTILPILIHNAAAMDRRVCVSSIVAIAIVAEVFSPSLVLIELINKYSVVPDRDAQISLLFI